MEKNLESYLKIYPAFDSAFCVETVKQLENAAWESHAYTNPTDYKTVSFDNELSVCGDIPNTDQVMKHIWDSFKAYLTDLSFSWFDSWAGFTAVRFNKYDVNTLMREHCDHIHSAFDGERKGVPTMTALGALNDEYEGGELIFWQDKQIVIPPGHIAVFPSNFLYPHKVNPVIKGVRYSFVAWAW